MLHKQSEPIDVNSDNAHELLKDLIDSLPEGQLGLAAPQINVHKRAFIAWLPGTDSIYGFINPQLKECSTFKTDSTEGCLSLPGERRTIERHASVTVSADHIIEFTRDQNGFSPRSEVKEMKLSELEAFIVQHEIDHLNGIIITDLPEIKSRTEKIKEREEKRREKILSRRQEKRRKTLNNIGAQKRKSAKEIEKEKKLARSLRKREQRALEIQERYKAEREGLFDNTSQPSS